MPDPLTGQSLALQTLLQNPATAIVAHLSKQPIALGGDPLTLLDIVECDYPGYAAVPITDWDVKQDENPAAGTAVSPNVSFTAGVIVTPQDAYALYLTIVLANAAPVIWRVFPIFPKFTFDQEGRTLNKVVRVKSFDDTGTPPVSPEFESVDFADVPIS